MSTLPMTSPQDETWRSGWLRARALFALDEHRMPDPTWVTRGFPDDGPTAWRNLCLLVPPQSGPLSVYVHIPFCASRCAFCDCHATVAPRNATGITGQYVRRLTEEIAQWRELGNLASRPVTTIHLGGGTPNALPPDEFAQAVQALAAGVGADKQTEWAIETSSRCLDQAHADMLEQLGFTRIHVGVQALKPSLRAKLGRHDPPETAFRRIEEGLRRNWVVSADMLYGLPGQTREDLIADLDLLMQAGVHGISLYRLNHGARNHRFMVRHGLAERGYERLYADYLMFMEAAHHLMNAGYARNHFTHFARPQDHNLYARHALRGEDLLAFGPTADGVFGDYYYRHGPLEDYLNGSGTEPALQGGGLYTPSEQRARPLVAQLMSGEIPDNGKDEPTTSLMSKLAAYDLVQHDEQHHRWILTPLGSWFAGESAAEAFKMYEASPQETTKKIASRDGGGCAP